MGLQPQYAQNHQFAGMYPQMQNNQMTALYTQQMLGSQVAGVAQQPMLGSTLTGFGYGQQPDAQFYSPLRATYPYSTPNELSQRTYGLSLHDNVNYLSNSSYGMPSSSSYLQQPNKPLKPEDKLFGDLVNIAKTKQNKHAPGKVESL